MMSKSKDERVTGFQSRVYDACKLVPSGYVTTYKLLAEHLRCRSPRAVGQALKRNPFAPEVPCHRVIGTDLALGGFRGTKNGPALDAKKRMLLKEGVPFEGNRMSDPSRVFNFKS